MINSPGSSQRTLTESIAINNHNIFEKIKYIMAPPRMKRYIDYSADIYEIYLKYISIPKLKS